jgi:hypothetical protein
VIREWPFLEAWHVKNGKYRRENVISSATWSVKNHYSVNRCSVYVQCSYSLHHSNFLLCTYIHRHSNSGPPFFLIWSLPRLWYGSLSGSISLNHLSIFYNISTWKTENIDVKTWSLVQRDPWKIIILYVNAWKSNLLLSLKTNQSPYSDASLRRSLICDSTFLLLHPVFRRLFTLDSLTS